MFARCSSSLLRIAFVGFAGSLLACSVAQGGIDDSEVEGSKPTSSPIIGGTKATAYPEAAIVDMYRGGVMQAACSGSVIAPQVVLTAGHCVDTFDGWRVRAPYTSSGMQTALSSGGITYDWAEGGAETVNPNHHDIGLIFLKTPIKLATYPSLASAKIADGSKVYNLGRINNGVMSSTDMFIGAAIAVRDARTSGFPYDYISSEIIQPGDSGGPDILAGTHQIVAVNSGGGGGTQVLARVDLLYSWIQTNIASHGGSGGTTPTPTPTPDPTPAPGTCGTNVEREPNDAYTGPNALAGTLCGSLTGGDQDWFTWSVGSTATPYDVKVVATGDAQIQMWKLVSGQYYSIANTSPTEFNKTSNGAGSYVVVVHSPSGAAQSYTLTLKK
jgi:hypothetical protein